MEAQINSIQQVLLTKFNFDIGIYNTEFVSKVIEKRISFLKIPDIQSYNNYFQNNDEEIKILKNVLIVSYSRFFRNSVLFEFIDSFIIPDILNKKKSPQNTFRAWSAGCATGEEPFSLAILFKEHGGNLNELETNIFATDIDKNALEFANRAIYNETSVQNVKYFYIKKYFTIINTNFKVNDSIKKIVNFSYFDLADPKVAVPPENIFGFFDIILCRNVYIYLQPDARRSLTRKFIKALSPGGYLVLGKNEFITNEFNGLLEKVSPYFPIYKKVIV